MNELTPLIRPAQSQVKIDSVAKECPSDGFNYPTFRQLNKHARLYLSQRLELNSSTTYNLFDVANSKGWFVAVKQASEGSKLIFSTLEDLRTSFSSAKDSPDNLFLPKRTLSTPSRVNIVRFACGDSRLLVAQDNGSILVYNTSDLFAGEPNEVHPLTSAHIQSTYLHQIVPNPGTEAGLSDLVAVVSDGKVQLLNIALEPQGGWVASDLMSQPIAISWSPKGKHLAIGLQTGDILTFSLTNKSTPHKHIPPTVDGILASLNWLGPGHTFRTSYASQSDAFPQQHIIVLDAKSSTATYFSPDHPYPCNDRNFQSAYVVSLPKWDTDSASNDESKSLTLVADASSVDVEVLGNIGNSWYRHSQENQLSLPMDSSMDENVLVAFASDLTDSTATTPIIYAYLNDGSLQGWHLEHSKPYPGIFTSNASGSLAFSNETSVATQGKDTDMGGEETSPASPFGQSSTSTNAFSAFSNNAFGQPAFAQKSAPAVSAFGQSSFGQPSTFGAATGFTSTSPFSQPSQTNAPPFASAAKPAAGFGAFGGSNNPFGNAGTSAFGSSSTGAFSGSNSGTPNAFGQSSFGSNNQSTETSTTATSSNMTREASMSDSTAGFGSFGLGTATPSDPNARNSMFGSFSATPANTDTTSSGFGSGSLVKPATGFGAFGSSKPSNAFEAPKPATTSAFSTTPSQPPAASGFGQSGFANPAFGKSGFGQPAFGQPAFGKPSLGAATITSAPTSGGFGAFANTPATFGTAAQQSKSAGTTAPTSGGFSSFASSTPSAFGSAGSTSEAKKAPQGGFGTFASSTPSAFGSAAKTTEAKPTSQGGFSTFASSSPSPFSSTPAATESKPASGTANAFNAFSSVPLVTKDGPKATSPFSRPAANATSPFAAPVTPATPATPIKDTAPRTSVFAPAGAFGATSSSTSPFAAPSRPSPFGSNDKESPERDDSPPSSPEPERSPPPSFSAFSTTPSSAPNAFSGLQSTPSSFKPASGFGAFGSFGAPSSSPFFKKPDETPPPVSAFALTSSPKTPTNATATAPTFGSTSALGGAKSPFAPVAPSTTTPSKPPTSGGFSAFSGASSNFSSYVGTKTSFADMLKTGGEEAKDPAKSPALASTSGSSQDSATTTPTATPISLFGAARRESPAPTAPVSAFAPITPVSTPFIPDAQNESRRPTSAEPSYGSISASSAASSFVDISREDDDDENSDGDAEHSGEEGEDENSFLTDDENDESRDEQSENGSEGSDELPEEGEERSPSPEVNALPSSRSRSPSATPQPETPSIVVSQPPDGDAGDDASASPTVERERSTTPSPAQAKESPSTPSPAPVPATPGAPSSSSPFGLGMGRPSTRPTRSSPLSNAVSNEESEEDETTKNIPRPPASPKSPVAILPVKLDEENPVKRPKTPPLLFALSGNKSPNLSTSSLPPVSAPTFKTPSLPSASPFASKPIKPESPAGGALGALAAAAAASSPSVFSKPVEKTHAPSPPIASPPSAHPATPSSLFGAAPAFPPPRTIPPPMFGQSPFGVPNAAPIPGPAGQARPLGIQSPTVPPIPGQGIFGGSLPQTPAQRPLSPFGAQKQTMNAGLPLSAGSPPTKSPLSFSVTGAQAALPNRTPPPPSTFESEMNKLEDGLQKECVSLVLHAQNELRSLANLIIFVRKMQAEHKVSKGGSRVKAGLSQLDKWALVDVEQFGSVLLQYEDDLRVLGSQREKEEQMLRQIQSDMLKAGTRREEIVRFNKAKNDKEFAKMLRSRTLGPEYSETQMHLRKSIRAVRDRIQKLETHLQEDKKKLAQSTSYKPSFRAPSLDTINRTYRNIEMVIEQQGDEVARLAARVSKLDIEEAGQPANVRDKRLPDAENPRSFTVTPNVAATTAAALNAERSARRLKNALLQVRSEPLLNVKAATAPIATPIAPNIFTTPMMMAIPPGESLFANVMPATEVPVEGIPADEFNPFGSSQPSGGSRGSTKAKKHLPPKRNSGTPASLPAAKPFATPPAFEWGPLPNFSSGSGSK